MENCMLPYFERIKKEFWYFFLTSIQNSATISLNNPPVLFSFYFVYLFLFFLKRLLFTFLSNNGLLVYVEVRHVSIEGEVLGMMGRVEWWM